MNSQNPAAIDIIRDEHLAISAVLFALRQTARQARQQPPAADFRLLRAILDYITAYPDRWHHPKEDQYLFATLRGRSAKADALIALLEAEHTAGEPMIAELHRLLDIFEEKGESAEFCEAAERYVAFEWNHMRREEDQLLPLAKTLIPAAEWERIDTAFQANLNPLAGLRPKDEAAALYQRILELTPRR